MHNVQQQSPVRLRRQNQRMCVLQIVLCQRQRGTVQDDARKIVFEECVNNAGLFQTNGHRQDLGARHRPGSRHVRQI